MPYLGSSPAATAASFAGVYSQSFSGNGSTTTFTLGRYVAQVANIEVIVNNVQQSPFDGSYSLTGGTSLVFSEAPSSGTNNIYVIYRDYPVQTLTDTGAVRKTGDTMTGNLNIAYNGYPSLKYQDASGNLKGEMYMGTSAGDWNLVVNGANRISVDSSGRVTKPYQSFFSAYSSTTGWGWSNGVLPFNATQYNVGNHFNTSTYTFTAPINGTYLFQVRAQPAVSFGQWFWYLQVNSSSIGYIYTTDAVSQYEYLGGIRIIQLNANDTVRIYGNGTHSGMYSSWFDNEFTGYLLG